MVDFTVFGENDGICVFNKQEYNTLTTLMHEAGIVWGHNQSMLSGPKYFTRQCLDLVIYPNSRGPNRAQWGTLERALEANRKVVSFSSL